MQGIIRVQFGTIVESKFRRDNLQKIKEAKTQKLLSTSWSSFLIYLKCQRYCLRLSKLNKNVASTKNTSKEAGAGK